MQCERIKIVEEALKLVKAHPGIELRLSTEFTAFSQTADGVTAQVTNPAGESEAIAGSYLVSAEGARSIVRKDLDIEFEGFTYPDRTLNIEVAYDFRQHGYTERNYISDPDEWSNLFHWKGPPDRWRVHFPTAPDADETALTRLMHCRRGCSASCRSARRSTSSAAISTSCTSAWRRNSAPAAPSSPAIPRT